MTPSPQLSGIRPQKPTMSPTDRIWGHQQQEPSQVATPAPG